MDAQYLVNDVMDARYNYNPQLGNWSSVSHRGNDIKSLVTIYRVRVKKNRIKVLIQNWEGPAQSNDVDDLTLLGTVTIQFKNRDFSKKLKHVRDNY